MPFIKIILFLLPTFLKLSDCVSRKWWIFSYYELAFPWLTSVEHILKGIRLSIKKMVNFQLLRVSCNFSMVALYWNNKTSVEDILKVIKLCIKKMVNFQLLWVGCNLSMVALHWNNKTSVADILKVIRLCIKKMVNFWFLPLRNYVLEIGIVLKQ